MDPEQVVRDSNGVMRCRQCGFSYNLGRDDVTQRAAHGLESVKKAVAATPGERRTGRPAPHIWSVNGYVTHLSQAATVINQRIRLIAETDRPALAWHDQDQAVAEVQGDERPAEESLDELTESVQAFQWYLSAMPAEAWERVGVHSKAGEVRLADIAQDMPHELEHHAIDIRRVGAGQAV